jgi:SPOR domain
MRTRNRFVVGGVGGLAPVLLFLITGDLVQYLIQLDTLRGIGYAARAIALFFVGGFIAYLHTDEDKPFKIFEIGLAAPALLAGALTTAQLAPSRPPAGQPETRVGWSIILAVPAHAQSAPADDRVRRFTLPTDGKWDQFLEGFIGRSPKNVWFVIVGSHLQLEDARKQAEKVNRTYPSFHAEVYAPYGDNPYYAVVIGPNLTQDEARALRDRAIQAGLPKDTYYKTFPNLPPPDRQ